MKNAARTALDKVGELAYRLRNMLTGHTPVHLVVCGPDDRLAKILTETIPQWYRSKDAVTVWAPAVAARKIRARLIVSWDADDSSRSERIMRKLSSTRKIIFVAAVCHPDTLVGEVEPILPHHFHQGADYRLHIDGTTKSMTRPGVVDRIRDVLQLTANHQEWTVVVRREDVASAPEGVVASLSDAISRVGGPKRVAEPTLASPPTLGKDSRWRQRVERQRERFEELDACAKDLGYPVSPRSEAGSAAPPRGMIIAFHTPDEVYSAEAKRLKKSLDALGLDYTISLVEPESNWVRTTLLKPTWIRPARERLRGPLLYIDVDAFVHEDPWPHLQELDADMAAVVYPTGELNSATLWINDTPGALALLDEWASGSTNRRATDDGSLRQIGDDSDQGVLRHVVETEEAKGSPSFRFGRLTPNLASIFDRHDDYRYGPVAIEQLQASREVTQREKRLARRRERLAQLGD